MCETECSFTAMIHAIAEEMAFTIFREQGFSILIAHAMAKAQRDRYEGAAHAALRTYQEYRDRCTARASAIVS